MAESDIYRLQGFGRQIGWGQRPALLVIDFVNGFLDPGMFGGGNIAEAAERTVPLLATARRAGIPIAFTRIVYAEDGSNCGLWCEKAPRLKQLTDSAPASHVIDLLAPRPGEYVLSKTQASSFFGTDLAAWLIARSVDTLLLAGCTTSGCIRATAVDAISNNFRPVVVVDCVGDRALGPHEANLFDMGQKCADLVTSSDVMERLDRLAATVPA